MKWILKRMMKTAAVLMGLMFSISLAGCSMEFKASDYVKGVLDNIYLGDSAIYRELVDITEEAAYEEYLNGMEAEADYMIQYYKIDGGVSEEVHEEIVKLYQEIYKYSRFEVSEAVRVGDDYQVDVKVSPIDVIVNSETDILKAVDAFSKTADPELFEDHQKLKDTVTMIAVETIRENLSRLGYFEDETVTVMVEMNDQGYYSIDSEILTQIDNAMIAY